MPIVESKYKAPWWLPGGHLQTLQPRLLRKVAPVEYQRERITTPDDDFLDLDWKRAGNDRVVILLHGLEGCSRSHYILGLVHALTHAGWDCVAVNFRSCGGELNRQSRFYHSGETTDLHTVVQHVSGKDDVAGIAIAGISLGGNVALKYLGEQGSNADPKLKYAVAISVPCDLGSSSRKMARFSNRIYMRHFIQSLIPKAHAKAKLYPGLFSTDGLESMRTFAEFDDQITAPLHGFDSAQDYWKKSSSRPYIPKIAIPSLLLSARNDPFLTPSCFPEEEAKASELFHLEASVHGGHAGFAPMNGDKIFWTEKRVVEFLQKG